jgi:hypothetical protein
VGSGVEVDARAVVGLGGRLGPVVVAVMVVVRALAVGDLLRELRVGGGGGAASVELDGLTKTYSSGEMFQAAARKCQSLLPTRPAGPPPGESRSGTGTGA